MIIFEIAKIEDAEELTNVETLTFDEDSRRFNNKDTGGPPGYNSIDWQIKMMHEGIYYKIIYDTKIIGGIILVGFSLSSSYA